jgi:hypothetical protein
MLVTVPIYFTLHLIERRTQQLTRSALGMHPVIRHISTKPAMYHRNHQAT